MDCYGIGQRLQVQHVACFCLTVWLVVTQFPLSMELARRRHGMYGTHSPKSQRLFLRLSTPLCDLTVIDRAVLERFGVLLYDKTSNCSDVNSARWHLLTKTGRQIGHIPPTSTVKELFTGVAISGVKQTIQHQPFLVHLNGAGTLWVETGSFSGQISLRHLQHVRSCSGVPTRRAVEENAASATKLG